MIRSMTGWGEAVRTVDAGCLRVEIKTVNHRFLNTHFRTPPGFDGLEHQMQAWIRPLLFRGHVSLTVTLERDPGSGDEALPSLDLARAARYKALLTRMATELELAGTVGLEQVARFSEIFRAPEPDRRIDVDPDVLRAAVEEATRAVVGMREAEGGRLAQDLRARAATLGRELDRIRRRAPERLDQERIRLRAIIRDLVESDDIDEERLTRELAYLAEKWDIAEELVRFRSHLEMFVDTLAGAADEGVGKRLGFIVQEMHREANTIGAKANDTEISHAVVGIKEEIERLREQVENVE